MFQIPPGGNHHDSAQGHSNSFPPRRKKTSESHDVQLRFREPLKSERGVGEFVRIGGFLAVSLGDALDTLHSAKQNCVLAVPSALAETEGGVASGGGWLQLNLLPLEGIDWGGGQGGQGFRGKVSDVCFFVFVPLAQKGLLAWFFHGIQPFSPISSPGFQTRPGVIACLGGHLVPEGSCEPWLPTIFSSRESNTSDPFVWCMI